MSVRLRKWTNAEGRVVERWIVDVKVTEPKTGKVIRVRDFSPVDTRRGAEQHERQIRQRILDGTLGKEQQQEEQREPVPTLAEFAERFLKVSTTNNKYSSVVSKQQILEDHLLPALEPPFDFLTFEESERLIEAAEPEWRPMVTLALKSGLRLGELFGLQWTDVDFAAGRLTVRRNIWRGVIGTPKGGRARTVDLPATVVRMLREHRHLKSPYVFCDESGAPRIMGKSARALARAVARAGITREHGVIGWHDLRHTYASHLVMRGTPLKVVQELLGHATMEMTMRYAHLSPEAKRSAVQCLDLPAPTPEGHIWGTWQ